MNSLAEPSTKTRTRLGYLRAVPDSGRLSRSHTARPRRDHPRLPVSRADPAEKGLDPVVIPSPRMPCLARISSLATYVPPRVLTNADLERMVDTSDEWILQRTGIRERHIVDPGVATSDLAVEAARKAIERAGLTPDYIDFISSGRPPRTCCFPAPRFSSRAPRRQSRVGLRPVRRVFPGHLRAAHSGADGVGGWKQACARHRRRCDVEHHRLHRSHHVL